MADTLNETKVSTTEGAEVTQERTFTESELSRIVEARVGKERARFSDYEQLKEKASRFDEIEEANKSELQKATERADELQRQLDELTKQSELRDIRTKVSNDTGVPISLLTATTEADCRAQAEAIVTFAKPQGYPTVKDGGETRPPATSKEQILSIKNERERLKAIEANIDLF